jgi:hypothetical protein
MVTSRIMAWLKLHVMTGGDLRRTDRLFSLDDNNAERTKLIDNFDAGRMSLVRAPESIKVCWLQPVECMMVTVVRIC